MQRWLALGCLLIALGTPVMAEQPGGTVTIPLDQFMKMTHPLQQGGGKQVPMPFILSRGDYRLQLQDKWMEVDGTISLRLYGSGQVEVPLLDADVVVAQASLDGQVLPLFVKDDKYTFIASGAGTHTVRLRYHLPVALGGATSTVEMKLPLTSVSTASMILPETSVRVAATPAIPLTTSVRNGHTVVAASLPQGGEQAVRLAWTPERANPLLHGRQSHEKPRIQARSYVLVTVSDKLVRTHARLDCAILRNETDRLTVDIPTGAEIVDLQCPKLSNYNVTDEAGYRRVHILLSEPVSGSEMVDLTTEQPLAATNSTWSAPVVALEEAEQVKGSLGVETTGGIEVTAADQHDVRGIDVRELPEEVSSLSASPLVLAFEYHRQPYRLMLSSQKGEEIPVLTATIDTADGMTLVTPEGKMVTRLTCMVRNNLKQNLTIKLPDGATMWSSYVNGSPVKPVKTTDGHLKIPLLRSPGEGTDMATVPVEITFVSDGSPAAALLGRQTVQAPEIDVPISQMTWSVYLPKSSHVWRLGGTMQQSTEDLPAPPAPPMGQAAAAEPSSQLMGVNNRALGAPQADMKKTEAVPDAVALSNMVNTTRQGAFPVRVYVPEVGQAYHFSSLMVARQMPSIVIEYSSTEMEGIAAGFLLFLGLTAGAGVARRYRWGAQWWRPAAPVAG